MIVTNAELRVLMNMSGNTTEQEEGLLQMIIPAAQAAIATYLKYDPEYSLRTELLPTLDMTASNLTDNEWRSNGQHATLHQQRAWEGQHGDLLQCSGLPVRGVVGLWEDSDSRHGTRSGAFSTALTMGEDYAPEYDAYDSDGNPVCRSGIIRRVSGSWPGLPGSVKVQYWGGYMDAELNGTDGQINARPIKEAIYITAMKNFRQYAMLQKDENAGWIAGAKVYENLGDYAYSVQTSSEAQTLTSFAVSIPPEANVLLSPFVNYGALLN